MPVEQYSIPFGEAAIVREGNDVTIVGIQKMVLTALDAADLLVELGVHAEVIDPRTYSPLDIDTIVDSVAKTGRLVVVDESHPRCSLATDIAAQVADIAFESLRSPIKRVTGAHTPIPFSPPLEDAFIPQPNNVVTAVMSLM